ncbi:hypothetical protein [Ruminococcus sp.]|uniref:hypothetical protein n=1 Tax=Ruminococcus sp. TaxID=41978 RepID=UPI0025F662D3|nr:hypothetical protein [Ruminococcus sp.]MBQ9541028.1 hypothetical protein [Ruminococcus sp.]
MRRKMKSNRQGAVLMTVTIVSVMMVVIVAAAISLVAHTNTKTNREYRKKQAYFAASSCLEAFVVKETNMIVDPTHTQEFIQDRIKELNDIVTSKKTATVRIGELNAAGDDVIDANLIGNSHPRWNDITVTLKLEPSGGDGIKAISTATYLGEEQKVVAYLNIQPLKAGTTIPGALEIIGTTGGSNTSYNNISVYGNTSAPDKASHDANTCYVCATNNDQFYGDTSIYGSLVFSGANPSLKANPYYVDGIDNGQTKGCTMYVSRSFVMGNNTPHIESTWVKERDYAKAPKGIDGYNYVQVDEALVMNGNNGYPGGCYIGSPHHEVDVYAGILVMGKKPSSVTIQPSGENLLDVMAQSSADIDDYKSKIDVGSEGSGNEIYGNVYLRKNTQLGSEKFDGSAYLYSNNGHIYGDLYVEGNVYVSGTFTVHGNVYFQGASGEDANSRIKSGSLTIVDESNNSVEPQIADWISSGGRATVPNNFNPLPYYYYPEHMLCLKEDGVSTIADTYAFFYKNATELKDKGGDVPYFYKRAEDAHADETAVFGTGETIDGIHFDAVVNQSFVLGYVENARILVDLDNAVENKDGGHDIVIMLNDNAVLKNNVEIIVRNSKYDPESDDARFCYLVSDSGIGYVDNNYMDSGKTAESGYSGFKPNPRFIAYDKFFVMEFDSYKAVIADKGLNPTDKDYGADPNVYNLPHGSIIILLTEGAEFSVHQQSILQCSIYGPRATMGWSNDGRPLKIYPTYAETNSTIATNVIGNCVVKNYNVSANNVTIVYNPVSSKSMVAVAHGFGQELQTSTFELKRYDNY